MGIELAKAPIPPLLMVTEAALAMRVSKMTVYRLVNNDEIDSVRVNAHVRISTEGLVKYLMAGGGDRENALRMIRYGIWLASSGKAE